MLMLPNVYIMFSCSCKTSHFSKVTTSPVPPVHAVSRPLAQSRTQTSSQHFLFRLVIGVRHQIILDWTFPADPLEVTFFSYPVWSPDCELALLGKGHNEIFTCFMSPVQTNEFWPHFGGVMLCVCLYGHMGRTQSSR